MPVVDVFLTNEFRLLFAAFNDLLQTVQIETQEKEHVAQMIDVLLREEALLIFFESC